RPGRSDAAAHVLGLSRPGREVPPGSAADRRPETALVRRRAARVREAGRGQADRAHARGRQPRLRADVLPGRLRGVAGDLPRGRPPPGASLLRRVPPAARRRPADRQPHRWSAVGFERSHRRRPGARRTRHRRDQLPLAQARPRRARLRPAADLRGRSQRRPGRGRRRLQGGLSFLVDGLAGLRTLVTGGAGGIGLAVVERLAAEGARVAATDLAPPEGTAAEVVLAADVTDETATDRLVAEAKEALGGLDALVLTAGIHWVGP